MVVERMEHGQMQDRLNALPRLGDAKARAAEAVVERGRPAVGPRHHADPIGPQDVKLARLALRLHRLEIGRRRTDRRSALRGSTGAQGEHAERREVRQVHERPVVLPQAAQPGAEGLRGEVHRVEGEDRALQVARRRDAARVGPQPRGERLDVNVIGRDACLHEPRQHEADAVDEAVGLTGRGDVRFGAHHRRG